MKRTPSTTTIGVLGIAGLAFLWSGCDPGKISIPFPHKPHQEAEMECTLCHSLEGERIAMPAAEVCMGCHEMDDEDVFGQCLECHKKHDVAIEEDSRFAHKQLILAFLPPNWDDVRYDHTGRLNDETDCLVCHQKIAESEQSSLGNLPAMAVAMKAQTAMGLSNQCDACHLELTPSTPPASHNQSWTKNHGRLIEFSGKESCTICHEEETCRVCHLTNSPQSHTNLWRRKTHGIKAAFDRSSCMVCHRSDECTVCHQAAANPIPASPFHTPDASCLTCHGPLAAQGPAPRPPQRFMKPMPHRMMMGVSSQKCLECHLF